MVNYLLLHFCAMGGAKWISVPVLVAILLLAFYILAETAENYFSPVVRRLVEMLGMTPSMGGVTLLALGNGAPDIFASLAAIGGDNSRIGFGAILSAGTFVSAFVVGSVALAAAPFSLQPMPFIRDVAFYLGAVCLLFIIYLKGEIVFWQAVGMVSFYVVFVVVVLCTDKKKEVDSVVSVDTKVGKCDAAETGLVETVEKNDKDGFKVSPKASPKVSPKEACIEDMPGEVAVTVDLSSFKIEEPLKARLESELPGDSFGKKCRDLFSSPVRRLNTFFPSEEVCLIRSFSAILLIS